MYGTCKEKCKKWLRSQNPEAFAKFYPEEAAPTPDAGSAETNAATDAMGQMSLNDEEEEKKRQSRGGKGLQRDASTQAEKETAKRTKAKVTIHITERNRRKAITYIKGLEVFGLELKKVAKRLAGKYACGCSVAKMPAGHEEVTLQGDFIDDLVDFLPKEYPVVGAHQIEVNIK